MTWTVESVLALLRTVLPHDPEHFVLEHDGLRLVIGDGSSITTETLRGSADDVPSAAADAAAGAASVASPQPEEGSQAVDHVLPPGAVTVPSPTVGTFYPRPEPSAPPYAEPGQSVTAGQTLGLVEVMKVFNAVPSPCDGIVHSVVAGDGDFVEHGQALVIIRPPDAVA